MRSFEFKLVFTFMASDNFAHAVVNPGPKGLHQVVGKSKSIAPARGMERQGRVQSGGQNGTGRGGAQNRIAIIQCAIYSSRAGAALEIIAHKAGPITAGGLGFNIVAVEASVFRTDYGRANTKL